ncbi:alkene reductase [Notoacmeibacter sp. MSK16QG-6]|uniref:alkene reductase n=1 Tax=Notoacmeibacter sp. MSK16QG-6 TaxID=2957982 RepID=UPI0020A18967|nr:alkene reductase [Notoacmeibacter sp. MSK16QG-6]MCP1198981.1 alkene reductase [Notoacmeibacter sp. MSK16QG-6]
MATTPLQTLFRPHKMGHLTVPNRVFMAPLTRNRAHDDGTPWSTTATYYAQRASAGLLISEATQINPLGKGYIKTPGIYADSHVEGWKAITDAVHAAGGRIYCQLWHVGRIRHVDIEPKGEQPVAPSAIRANAKTFTHDGFADVSEPRALSLDEIDQIVEDFAHATRCAMAAGFDGVEVHSANGYLLDQFLHSASNRRDDEYGGSIENRSRMTLRVVDRIVQEIGSDRVGIRLSPLGEANDVQEDDPTAIFSYLVAELDKRELAYLHFVESFAGADRSNENAEVLKSIRQHWNGFYVANGAYDAEYAAKYVDEGWCHAVAVGRDFLANPDLPSRWLTGAELNAPDQDTFYGGGEEGYTDYPFATLGR